MQHRHGWRIGGSQRRTADSRLSTVRQEAPTRDRIFFKPHSGLVITKTPVLRWDFHSRSVAVQRWVNARQSCGLSSFSIQYKALSHTALTLLERKGEVKR
jgi:hypothetical protein